MSESNLLVSSTAWLCEKEQFIQNAGLEGVLSFDGNIISFLSTDRTTDIKIPLDNLQLADLNNIMGHSQIVFHTHGDGPYIFIFHTPVSTQESLRIMFFYSKAAANYLGFTRLSKALFASKKWRDILINSLPPGKIKYRNEARLWFIATWSFVFLAVLFAVFFVILQFVT